MVEGGYADFCNSWRRKCRLFPLYVPYVFTGKSTHKWAFYHQQCCSPTAQLRTSPEGSSRPTAFLLCCCCLLRRRSASPLRSSPASSLLTDPRTPRCPSPAHRDQPLGRLISGRQLGAAQGRARRITASCPPERAPNNNNSPARRPNPSTPAACWLSAQHLLWRRQLCAPGWKQGEACCLSTVYEILIRLPVKELCRLRVVCWPWRSLLSDPQFIAAHATRHHRPLFVVGHGKSYHDDGILCDIIDLSGRVIKQIIRSTEVEWLISTQLNLACIAKGTSKCCQMLNLVTRDRFSLPEGLSQEHTPRKLDLLNYRTYVALGHVASTGEFKLLRVIDNAFFSSHYMQLCEVFTLSGSGDARWRGKKVAQYRLDMSRLSRVVVDGVVYFLLDEDLFHPTCSIKRHSFL